MFYLLAVSRTKVFTLGLFCYYLLSLTVLGEAACSQTLKHFETFLLGFEMVEDSPDS